MTYLFLDWDPIEQEARGPHGLVGNIRRDGDGWRWRVYHRDAGPEAGDSGRALRRKTAEKIVQEIMDARREEETMTYLFLDWDPIEQEARGPHGLVGNIRRDGDGWRWRVYHRDAGPEAGDSGRALRRKTAEKIVQEIMDARRDEVEAATRPTDDGAAADLVDDEVPL